MPFFFPISFLTNVQYLIAFNTYPGSAEYPALTAPLPLSQNIVFSLCVTTTETGNGKCLSKTLLCDSVSNRRGAYGRSGRGGGGRGGAGGGEGVLCCSRHVASVGCLRSATLIIPRHSGQ